MVRKELQSAWFTFFYVVLLGIAPSRIFFQLPYPTFDTKPDDDDGKSFSFFSLCLRLFSSTHVIGCIPCLTSAPFFLVSILLAYSLSRD